MVRKIIVPLSAVTLVVDVSLSHSSIAVKLESAYSSYMYKLLLFYLDASTLFPAEMIRIIMGISIDCRIPNCCFVSSLTRHRSRLLLGIMILQDLIVLHRLRIEIKIECFACTLTCCVAEIHLLTLHIHNFL